MTQLKEVSNKSNNNINNNNYIYNHSLKVIRIYRIYVTVVQKFGSFPDRESQYNVSKEST